LFQNEFAQIGISITMQQIRCALDKGIGLAKFAAEFEQPALAKTIIGNSPLK
jgi:hypothetical protein